MKKFLGLVLCLAMISSANAGSLMKAKKVQYRGTVAGLRISSVNGTAFVDNANASIAALADGLHQIEIYDSSWRVMRGVLKAAGSSAAFDASIVDAAAAAFTSGTYSWLPYGTNSITNDSNTLKIAYVDHFAGAYWYMRDAYDLSSDLTALALYKLGFDTKVGSGNSVDIIMGITGNPTVATVTETSMTAKTFYYTAQSADNDYVRMNNMGSGEIIWLDNLSLQKQTAPGATGATVVSEKSGSTYNWAYIQASFGYNQSAYYVIVRKLP